MVFDTAARCWGWAGTRATRPYYNRVPATHAVWGVFGQELPDGYHLHHVCGNPECVNPWHLRPMVDEEHYAHHAEDRRAATACQHGHEWTVENTGFHNRGVYVRHRYCRACARDRMARNRARKKGT